MSALYIHTPYCTSKCPYCDFASVPIDETVEAYLCTLAKEASNTSAAVSQANTLYVGGGTPTVLSPAQTDRLFECLRSIFHIPPQAEITVEANPCSLTQAKAETLAANGVNRVSIGAQSFIDAELDLLKRWHRTEDISRCVSYVRKAGIDNLSLDLIYALPIQSVESWRHSISCALELAPQHISAYCLTFEKPTPFWTALQKGNLEKKSDEEELEFYEIAREMLTGAGYEHYEISNFALPGRRSLHNMNYWSNGEYLGLGASAVSYLDGKRITNLSDPKDYIRSIEAGEAAACEIEEIPWRMQAVETAIQNLRLRDGIDCAAFAERFGVRPKEVFGASLEELARLGLLECGDDVIRPSTEGWHLANEVALRLLP